MAFVNLLDVIYPIGSLYISFNNVSPTENIGGQWEPIIGRFPYFSDKIETGGENAHTLTINEMPSHSHQTLQNNNDGTISGWGLSSINGIVKKEYGFATREGGSQPHNNMPAYQSMYAWRRVA